MGHSLLFDDSIELCDNDGKVSGGSYWFETLAEGATFGEPQPVEVAINSLLRDGALVEKQGDGNREQSFLVRVKSTDSGGIAAGVAALHLATGKRTTLVWTPPDGYGPSTVFDVETSSLHEPSGFDDLAWMRNEQVFRLRLVCLPFGRSLNKVIDAASSPPGAGEGSIFYAAESTAGWASFGGSGTPSFSVDSTLYASGTGSIKSLVTQWSPGSNSYDPVTNTGGYTANGGTSRDEITGLSLDTGTGGYVSVAIRLDPLLDASAVTNIWQSTSSGTWTPVTSFAAVKTDANGFVHYRWAVAAGQTIIGLRFQATLGTVGQVWDIATPYVRYDDFRIMPTASTEQQIIKQLKVSGSARTTGSLHIGSGTESVALGQVLVATVPTNEVPAGFDPQVRPWVTQGSLTTDATALNGSYYSPDASTYLTASGKPIFNVPAHLLTPGAYTIVALAKSASSTITCGVQAQLNVNGTTTGPTSEAEVTLPSSTTGWQFVTIGTVYLPPVPVHGADSTTTVRLLCKGAAVANLYMIPAWQVGGRPVADFSIVDCGTGTASAAGPSSHLWIDSPSRDQPQGGWWRGPTADRLNTRSAWPDAKKPGIHTFRPGDLTAVLVSASALAPTLALEYYPSWLGSAAS